MNDGTRIGYSEFVAICHVDDPRDFSGFRLELDGLYVDAPRADDLLTPKERATLSWHPTGDHSKPALPLPCTLTQLRAFVAIGESGLSGCIDEDEVDALPVGASDAIASTTTDSLLNGVPGKLPNTAMGKLAIAAAWQIEIQTERSASAKQVVTLLQAWADSGKEPCTLLKSDKQKSAVIWITGKGKTNRFDIGACEKALETWRKSRA